MKSLKGTLLKPRLERIRWFPKMLECKLITCIFDFQGAQVWSSLHRSIREKQYLLLSLAKYAPKSVDGAAINT